MDYHGPMQPKGPKYPAPDEPHGYPTIPVVAFGEHPRHDPPPLDKHKRITAADMVVLPKHYARYQIEPIRFIAENGIGFMEGNIIKYVVRSDAKNGLEDLLKAIRYSIMLYRRTAGDPDWWTADPFIDQIRETYGNATRPAPT
jgi:hypothetical protein